MKIKRVLLSRMRNRTVFSSLKAIHRILSIGRFWNENHGVAAVELALVMPVFLIIMVCLVDLALAYNAKLKISAAVSAASYYAFQRGQNIADANAAAAYMSGVSDIITGMVSNLNSELTIGLMYNNKTTGEDAALFYCVSGYPPNYTNPATASVSCGGNVMSGKFLSIRVEGRIVPFFVSEEIFGSYLSVSEVSLVRVR